MSSGCERERALRACREIREDLEDRGVAPEFSRSVAERLTPIVADLRPEAYQVVLQAVAASYGVHHDDLRTLGRKTGDVDHIQRLMRGFAGELRKLEEALGILNAYVTRMRSRAARPGSRTLH